MSLAFLDRAGQGPCRHGHYETGKDDADQAYHDTEDSADCSYRRYVSVSNCESGYERQIDRISQADFLNKGYQDSPESRQEATARTILFELPTDKCRNTAGSSETSDDDPSLYITTFGVKFLSRE